MRFGSVCSGIEAASVAWGPLGWKAAWFSEIEPFPCAVLAHHYPEVLNHGDMTALPQLIRSSKVEAPDLFCGGTPCQAFSVAGLRRSLDDERGNLSLTFVEIADAIDDVRRARGDAECIVFWENVPGVLSTQDNAFGCFLGALAGCDTSIEPLAATGWTDAGVVAGPQRTVAWRVLDAQYFGLAQRRKRVFVVASAREGFDPAAVLLEFEGVRRDSAPSREAGKVAPTIPARSTAGGGLGTDFDCDGGVIQAFGGGQNCTQTDVSTALSAHPGGSRLDFQTETFVTHTLGTQCSWATEDGTGRGSPLVPVAMRESGQGYWMQDNIAGTLRAEGEDRPSRPSHVIGVPVAHAFDARQSGVIQYGDKSGPLDTDGHSIGVAFTQNSRSEVRHIGGDGQIVGALAADSGAQQQNYVAQAVAFKYTMGAKAHGIGYAEEQSPTLDTRPESNAVVQAMQVRRLTPVECERLQGFPDGYTAIPWRNKPASECPDGPRYKALGNSWAVPVVRWIGQRIQEAL